jgi:hypothetical protein
LQVGDLDGDEYLNHLAVSLQHSCCCLRYLHDGKAAACRDPAPPVLTRFLLEQAGPKASEADSGAVTLIQRFGSAANLNSHLHCRLGEGGPVFVEAAAQLTKTCRRAAVQDHPPRPEAADAPIRLGRGKGVVLRWSTTLATPTTPARSGRCRAAACNYRVAASGLPAEAEACSADQAPCAPDLTQYRKG